MQLTRGGCSCDFYLPPAAADTGESAKERARLQAKGWSTAKIERALAAKRESAARPLPPEPAVTAFRDLVAAVVAQAGSVHLHAHFRSGGDNEELAAPIATVMLPLASFLASGFPPETVATVLVRAAR